MPRKPTLTLNVLSIYNSTTDKKSKEVQAALSNSAFRFEYGRRVIDEITKRTLSGIDKQGSGFKGYSKSYKDSDIFKIYNKSSQVNLKLTGAMLDSMESFPSGTFNVDIKFLFDFEKDKATWHINGTPKMPKRDFLGLPDKILGDILIKTLKDFNTNADVFNTIEAGEVDVNDFVEVEQP